MPALCQCGCGLPAPLATHTQASRARRKGEPVAFIRGHNAKHFADLTQYEVRDTGLSTPCWIWTGRIRASNGRGIVQTRGVKKNAHRALYEAAYGPLPADLHLDHLCRNKLCVNPSHMEPVTPAENSRRRYAPMDPRMLRAEGAA